MAYDRANAARRLSVKSDTDVKCFYISYSCHAFNVFDVFRSACLSVCLSVRSHISKSYTEIYPHILSVSCVRGSLSLAAMQYVTHIFSFVDDVVFSLGTSTPETIDDAYVSSSSPGGGTSRTSDNVVWSSSPPPNNSR